MKKISLDKVFSVKEVMERYIGVDVSDFKKSGVYKIEIGSRGEVENVEKVSDVNEVLVCEDVGELFTCYYGNMEEEEGWDEDDCNSVTEWMYIE